MPNNAKKIIKKIRNLNKKNQQFSDKLVDTIVSAIRKDVVNHEDRDGAVPITAVTNKFGIAIIHTDEIDPVETGILYVNHEESKKRHKNGVIFLRTEASLYAQRYATAHLLGDYLLNYTGNPPEIEKRQYVKHCRNWNTGLQNRIAQKFATAMLMPTGLFIKEHNLAIEIDNDRAYVIGYLSKRFQVSESLIERKIYELRQRQK